MLIFNCTKAAAEFFTVTRKGEKISPLDKAPTASITDRGSDKKPISQWLVHAIKIQRKHVLIAMEVNTRYAMVFADLKKGDINGFITLLIERLFNNMQLFGEEFEMCDQGSFEAMLETFIQQHAQPYFCLRGDRSVQSHINDVVWHFERRVYEEGCLPNNHEQAASFDEWLNSQLRKTKQHPDYFHPDEEMFVQWLENYGDAGQELLEFSREQFATLRRASFSAISEVLNESPEFTSEMLNEVLNNKDDSLILPDNVVDFLTAKNNKK